MQVVILLPNTIALALVPSTFTTSLLPTTSSQISTQHQLFWIKELGKQPNTTFRHKSLLVHLTWMRFRCVQLLARHLTFLENPLSPAGDEETGKKLKLTSWGKLFWRNSLSMMTLEKSSRVLGKECLWSDRLMTSFGAMEEMDLDWTGSVDSWWRSEIRSTS